jgi:dipeptide/tripeptide permease
MTSYSAPGYLWWYAAGWAAAGMLIGFTVFYRAEASYSRG